ncbi:unnamed protein product [Adineta steineri]|uniref:Uncharacterized protein n=1 Tax=Adineta steineri TaxID=433720 RepID=A0A813TK76_9BILA|nr:unnamed protein product [Adineta steineri]CAF1437249.1 unnamed protein product [Adineta steineri]CAF3825876.1 unnamed protein product [Adineta steineri]CAF3892867.1 unnamed protein product [Adineta steineri]
MEHRLVLNNLSELDIPNNVLSGQLQQKLKEQDTYFALREAKLIKDISLVRYHHRNLVPLPLTHLDDIRPTEMEYHHPPSSNILNLIKYNCSTYIDRFGNKELFKLFVKRVVQQITAQRMPASDVYDRICKLKHWWWLNERYFIANVQNIQKLLDVFFK